MDDKSELKEKDTVIRMLRAERNFNIAKLFVIIVAAIFTALSVIYYVRKDNDRTRDQINCVVDGFLQPPQNVPNAVRSCRK